MGNDIITEAMRREMAGLIPQIVKKAFRSYETFMVLPPDIEEAKKYAAYYTACKLALSHLEMLMKLLEQLNAHLETAERRDNLAQLLTKAQQDVKTYRNKKQHHDQEQETD